jgi:hypothetical protein
MADEVGNCTGRDGFAVVRLVSTMSLVESRCITRLQWEGEEKNSDIA